MSYKREADPILTGSLNLLPPGDLLPAEDAIALQNWRVDQQGALRSRLDQALYRDFGAGKNVNSLWVNGTTPNNYLGVDDKLYRDLEAAPLDTGFDGRPLGFANFWGSTCVMNRAKRGRDRIGVGWGPWAVTAPASGPTVVAFVAAVPAATAAADGSLLVDRIYKYAITYVDLDGNESDVSDFAGLLTEAGFLSADIVATDPSDATVAGWNLYRYSPISLSAYDAGARLNSTLLTDWGDANPFHDDGSAGGVLPRPGELAAGKQYSYYITYVNEWSEESNPSDAGTYVPTDTSKKVKLTAPATADATIVSWNLYRVGNTLEDAYRINADPIPIAGLIFLDDGGRTVDGVDQSSLSDLEVTRLGIAMQTDNDAPPACSGLVGPYYDRLLAFSSADHPNWLWYCKQGQPHAWPGAALDEGNHTPVGEDGEELLACTIHPRNVRLYKERSIWRCAGDPGATDSVLEQTNEEIGLTGPQAICPWGEIDYFEGAEGIYAYNGYGSPTKITPKLDPLFKGDALLVSGSIPSAGLNLAAAMRRKNQLMIRNGRLYFSYVPAGGTLPTASLVFDLASARWYSDDRGFTALFCAGQGFDFLGASAGAVNKLEQPQTSTIALAFQTGYRDQGQKDHQKTYADLVMEYSVKRGAASDQSLTAKAYYDHGATSETLGTIPYQTIAAGPDRVRAILPCGADDKGQLARNLSLQIAGDALSPVAIFSLEAHYYLHPRDSITFDTAPIHLGHQGVKRVNMIELDIAAGAAVSWELLTDRPGGVMTQRATGTVAATTGRQSIQIPIADKEGRLLQVRLWTALGTFRLYGLRLRVRKLGLYVDGAAGETWKTPELDSGVPYRVKYYRRLVIDAQLDGSTVFSFNTDLPGPGMTLSRQVTLTTTTGRAPIRVLLPGTAQGTFAQAVFAPTAAMELFGIQLFHKVAGEAQETPWSWTPLAVPGTSDEYEWMDVAVDE